MSGGSFKLANKKKVAKSKLLEHDDFNKNILAVNPGSILDVGSGRGRYFEWTKKYGIGYEGVDVDKAQIKAVRAKYATKAFHSFDGQNLSKYDDNSFDAVLLIEVVEHIEDLEALKKLLKECIRVARHHIFFTTPNCADEAFLIDHRLIYHHYLHTVGEGFNFQHGDSHMHYQKWTKKSLSNLLNDISASFVIEERVPLDIRSTREPDRVLHFKLWGIIDSKKSKSKIKLPRLRLAK